VPNAHEVAWLMAFCMLTKANREGSQGKAVDLDNDALDSPKFTDSVVIAEALRLTKVYRQRGNC
jgi:hypothetical protein